MLSNRLFYGLLSAVVLINFTALALPIMEPDNGLYATVAKRMFLTGDYVNLFSSELEWLDKPRLPFLLNVLFMKLLGITTTAYKLPALLCFCGSLTYTYLFARLNYSKLVAQLGTLIFGTAYHVILSNTDVRAEPFLTLFIISPAYHFMRVVQGGGVGQLVLGSLLTACAMMTKGPVVPIATVGAGLFFHCALTGQWQALFHPRWLVAGLLTALFITPELWALYQQFDAHPEKVIYGQTGTSGLRFFFWDSQMGRFLNNGPLRGSGDPLLFTHTLLWAFLPWAFLFYTAAGRAIVGLIRRQNALPEYLSLGAGVTLFILFSASRFQLPHYLNIVFPFYAILAAHLLGTLSEKGLRTWTLIQTIIAVIVWLGIAGIVWFYRPDRLVGGLVWIGVLAGLTTVIFWRNKPGFGHPVARLTGRMVGLMVMIGGVINLFLYPAIMTYQAGMMAADYANARPELRRTTWFYGGATYGESTWSYEYYTQSPTHYVYADSTLRNATQKGPVQVLTTPHYADSLARQGFQVRRIALFPYYHVSQLSGAFLNPATRPGTLTPYLLAEVR